MASGEMRGGFKSKIKLAIGRLIGSAKRKEKDLVQEWMNMCHAQGLKPGDRCLQLILWDLQQGGVDLSQVKQALRMEKIQEAFDQAAVAQQISQLSQQFALEMMKKDAEYTKQIESLLAEIRSLREEQAKSQIKIRPARERIPPNDPNRFVR